MGGYIKHYFINSLLLCSSFFISAVDPYLQNTINTFKNYRWYNTSIPSFFQTTHDNNLIQFLKKNPSAFYGLLYRTQNNDAITTFLPEWSQLVTNPKRHTQSTLHLMAHNVAKPLEFFNAYNYDHQYLMAWFKERDLQDDYFIFYHAQKIHFGFLQEFTHELITALFEKGYLNTPLTQDFLFIQNPDYMQLLINQNAPSDFLQKEQHEQTIMMQGRIFTQEKNRKTHRFSANAFLFANFDRSGSCTWEFYHNNSNIHYYTIDYEKECFTKLGLPTNLFTHYKDTIIQLQKEYEQFFEKGRLLQIAIPKTLIDQCAYLASDGGYKDPVYTNNGTVVSTASEFFTHFFAGDNSVLKIHAPQTSYRPGIYEVEFCLPLTADKLLNPHSGIKVFGYNGVPRYTIAFYNRKHSYTISYEQHCKKRKQLCTEIAQATLNGVKL